MTKWASFLVLAALCFATARVAADSSCSCSGVLRRRLDCSNRGRNSFSSSDLCSGRTVKIDLSRNSFTTFPSSLGSHIVEVNISRNQLTAMPRAPPLNLKTNLLDVSENRISQASNELRTLSELTKLFCNGNQLQSLSFLPEPCDLEELIAHHNAIRSLDGPLRTCSKLETLDLSYNQLTLARGSFAGLRELEELRLEHDGLTALAPGVFEGLPNLELLDLSRNGLTTLPSNAFSSLEKTEKLYLDGNNIATLPGDAFVGLRGLEVLKLNKNKLTELPLGVFASLLKLQVLELNDNQIRNLPQGAFSGLQRIESISLTGNQLQVAPPRLFAGIRSLKKVYLDQNRLTVVPADLFSGLSSLDMIDLSHNTLSTLPSGLFQGVNSVKHLDLSFNRFTTISGRELAGLQSIERLDLMYNQFASVPTYDNHWPDVASTFLAHNNIADVGEAELRSWLGDGSKRRLLSLGSSPLLRHATSLRWALHEGTISTTVADNCQCGALKLDSAEVQFCMAVSCPGTKASWEEAVRTS